MAILKYKGSEPRDLAGICRFTPGFTAEVPDVVAGGLVKFNPELWEIIPPAEQVAEKRAKFAQNKKYDTKTEDFKK